MVRAMRPMKTKEELHTYLEGMFHNNIMANHATGLHISKLSKKKTNPEYKLSS